MCAGTTKVTTNFNIMKNSAAYDSVKKRRPYSQQSAFFRQFFDRECSDIFVVISLVLVVSSAFLNFVTYCYPRTFLGLMFLVLVYKVLSFAFSLPSSE